jgi:hypothetical protein
MAKKSKGGKARTGGHPKARAHTRPSAKAAPRW